MSMFGEEKKDLNYAYDDLVSFIKRMCEQNRKDEAVEDIMSCVAYVLREMNNFK